MPTEPPDFAHHVELLAWLLPLIGLLLIGIGIATSRDRPAAGRRAGFGVIAAGVVLGSAALALGIVAELVGRGAQTCALSSSPPPGVSWTVRSGGCALLSSCVERPPSSSALSSRYPAADGAERRTWRSLVATTTPSGLVGRAVVLAVAGVALLARPELVLRLIAGIVGLVLLLLAAADLLAARSAAAASGGLRLPRRFAVPLVLLPPVFVVLAMLAVNADPGEERIPIAATQTAACNGHRELCTRPYDEVAFPATHNSMTAADENWYLPEQPTGIVGQLDDGIRVFLIDSWYGQATNRPPFAVTAEGSKLAALAEAHAEYGPEVVASALRLRDAASLTPIGPSEPYLCHSLCELGAVRWETEMTAVERWLATHPREVVTFFVQDEVTPADTDAVFRTAGLLPYVHTQRDGRPWPTLGQMIDSGRRRRRPDGEPRRRHEVPVAHAGIRLGAGHAVREPDRGRPVLPAGARVRRRARSCWSTTGSVGSGRSSPTPARSTPAACCSPSWSSARGSVDSCPTSLR